MRNCKSLSVFNKLLLIIVFIYTSPSWGVVNIDKTRVILSGNSSSQSISLYNDSQLPVVVQSWTDFGNMTDSPESVKTPVIALPPIFKMQPGELMSLRLLLTDRSLLNKNVESMLWVNIFQVYPEQTHKATDVKKVSLPLRLRIKLFIRPKGLSSPTVGDYKKISFTAKGEQLDIHNPTKWNMSMTVKYSNGQLLRNIVVKPLTTETLSVPNNLSNVMPSSYDVINDEGSAVSLFVK